MRKLFSPVFQALQRHRGRHLKRPIVTTLAAAMLVPIGGTALADEGPCVLTWFDSDDNPAMAVRWSPDEQLVFSHGLDGTVRVWSAGGGPPLATLPGQQEVGPYSVVPTPDSARAAITGPGYSTVMVEAESLNEIWRVEEGGTPSSFSSDGRYLATGHYGVARILDAASGAVVAEHVIPEGEPGYFFFEAQFLAGDRWVLLVDPASPPRLWDWQADTMHDINFREGGLIAAVSLDGTRFAVGGDLGGDRDDWRIWDAEDFLAGKAKEPTIVQRHLAIGNSMLHSFTPDGEQVLGGWMDRTITIWDVKSGDQVQAIPIGVVVGGAQMSGDGSRVLAGGRPARVYLLEGQDYFDGPQPMRCTGGSLD
jgi:WD40 repeat protein